MDRNSALVLDLLKGLRDSPLRSMSIHQLKASVVPSPDSTTLRYHLELMTDAGLVSGTERTFRLTWAGHDYLIKSAPSTASGARKRR